MVFCFFCKQMEGVVFYVFLGVSYFLSQKHNVLKLCCS